jgi:hypothetical protein
VEFVGLSGLKFAGSRAEPQTKYCDARKSYFYAISSKNMPNISDQVVF